VQWLGEEPSDGLRNPAPHGPKAGFFDLQPTRKRFACVLRQGPARARRIWQCFQQRLEARAVGLECAGTEVSAEGPLDEALPQMGNMIGGDPVGAVYGSGQVECSTPAVMTGRG
jgi:hypothetical protein